MLTINYEEFGPVHTHIVKSLLTTTVTTLEDMSKCKVSENITVQHWDQDYPCTVNTPDGPVVYLAVKEDYWCQWLYQFAHEYTHLLIGRDLTGRLKGLVWFEECLCHTASLFCLSVFSYPTIWSQLGYPHYALSVQQYIEDRFASLRQMREEFYHANSYPYHLGLRIWLPLLSVEVDSPTPPYPRHYYDAVAAIMLPFFLHNHHLWEIIGHIGFSEKWQSLEELLTHLASKATPEYSQELQDMRTFLIGE
ncbi:MAG: hypothetical protein K2J24_09150 [Muribaculaceae bacterium]|nr:hypothetical protein [Muribaculaceae bacterium]